MSYSCTKSAADRLEAIMLAIVEPDQPHNQWFHFGNTYFFERGRENSDGAITGTVYRNLPDGHCRRAGTVRIEGNGEVTRFSCISNEAKTAQLVGERRHTIPVL